MNQKFIICLIFIQLLTFSLLAQDYLISKTKTITNETTFGDLRSACHTPGYDSFIDNNAIPPSNKTP